MTEGNGVPEGADAALGTVLRVLAGILPGPVPAAMAPLLNSPGFDSLALAALVEALEGALGHELPDELIVPETFETPARVAAVLVAPTWAGECPGLRSRAPAPAVPSPPEETRTC